MDFIYPLFDLQAFCLLSWWFKGFVTTSVSRRRFKNSAEYFAVVVLLRSARLFAQNPTEEPVRKLPAPISPGRGATRKMFMLGGWWRQQVYNWAERQATLQLRFRPLSRVRFFLPRKLFLISHGADDREVAISKGSNSRSYRYVYNMSHAVTCVVMSL